MLPFGEFLCTDLKRSVASMLPHDIPWYDPSHAIFFVALYAALTFIGIGLLAAAAAIDADTVFYEPEILNQVVNEQDLTISDFVKEKIGVGSVCEAAAICGAKNSSSVTWLLWE